MDLRGWVLLFVLSSVLTRGGHGMNVKEGDGAVGHSGECHSALNPLSLGEGRGGVMDDCVV